MNAADFWRRVARRADDECWEWQGPTEKRGGHGVASDPKTGGFAKAHRVAYELTHGPIGEGLVIRHTCDNAACCNPEHLITGTQRENVIDMHQRGRHPTSPARRNQRPPAARLGVPRCYLKPMARGPIVNVCGPPGAGKSTLIAELEDDRITVLSADEARAKFKGYGRRAWDYVVGKAVENSGTVVIESSGLSVSLRDLHDAARLQGRAFATVIVTASAEECRKRTGHREQEAVKGVGFTIEDMIRDCRAQLRGKWPHATVIDTSVLSPEASLGRFLEALARAMGIAQQAEAKTA